VRRLINWQILLGLVFICAAFAAYLTHYLLFHDARLLIRGFIEYLAFFFVQIMIATFIIDKLLNYRERREMLKKMNMAIGVFYSEVGTEFLKRCTAFDRASGAMAEKLRGNANWSDKDFTAMARSAGSLGSSIEIMRGDLEGMKALLLSKRNFLLMLLENPNLLEHDSFTDLLWAVFHLTEELSARAGLKDLKPKDAEHVALDIKRAYVRAASSWLSYMKHLKHDYPYLFSFAVRTNPFDPAASIEVN
jgi:hypothetical protein